MSNASGKPRAKTKYQRVRDAVLADIEGGKLRSGDRLPSEDQLVSQFGVSLGTVQRALRELSDLGFVVRMHGSGTFVSGARPPEEHLRHFRFFKEDGVTLLPVFFRTTMLEHTNDTGPWVKFLGESAEGYIKIHRLISVNREFDIFSELYLSSSKFPMLLDMVPADLDGVSIRDLLTEKMNTPTIRTEQTVVCQTFPPRVSRVLDMPMGLFGLVMTIRSETFRHAPIIWQRAFIPPCDHEMEILTSSPG